MYLSNGAKYVISMDNQTLLDSVVEAMRRQHLCLGPDISSFISRINSGTTVLSACVNLLCHLLAVIVLHVLCLSLLGLFLVLVLLCVGRFREEYIKAKKEGEKEVDKKEILNKAEDKR